MFVFFMLCDVCVFVFVWLLFMGDVLVGCVCFSGKNMLVLLLKNIVFFILEKLKRI